MICPKCGAETATDECIGCGVFISKFMKAQEKVSEPTEKTAEPDNTTQADNKIPKVNKCEACGGMVSANIEACPHCGEPQKKESFPDEKEAPAQAKKKNGTGAAVIFFIIIGFYAYAEIKDLSPDSPKKVGSPEGAFFISQQYVKDKLRSPSSAEFPSLHDNAISIVKLGNKKYKVRAYVDAQNTFGAKIRNRYECIVVYAGDDRWNLESVDVY